MLELLISVIISLALFALLIKIGKQRNKKREMQIFEKVYLTLHEDAKQNGLYPESYASCLQENEPGRGISDEYGRCIDDPVRVNGPLGELTYISRLMNKNGVGFIGHRLGSMHGVDIFEIVSEDFEDWDLIYFDMYWLSKDLIAPDGLELVTDGVWPGGASGISATNNFLAHFPNDFWPNLMQTTNALLNFPAVKTNLKHLNTNDRMRPSWHDRSIRSVIVEIRAKGVDDDS